MAGYPSIGETVDALISDAEVDWRNERRWTSIPWLHRVTQPTLILAGDDDPVIPLANARFMARRMPAARLRVVEGGSHLFLIDQPEPWSTKSPHSWMSDACRRPRVHTQNRGTDH
jgi:pimeloyl-ACP methyl ester carboxylesterase